MDKKDLTVDNIAHYINLEYKGKILDDYRNLRNCTIVYSNIMKYFFNITLIFENIPYDRNHKIRGACAFLNEHSYDKWYSDIFIVDFKHLYPSIICKLINNGEIEFKIKELGILYLFLYTNMGEIISHHVMSNNENNLSIFRVLMNFMYGLIGNYKKITSNINDCNKITGYTRPCFDSLRNDENIIHVDVDIIHVKKITDELIEKLDKLNLKYEINDVKVAHFIRVMKYATISENDGLKIRGFEYKTIRKRRSSINRYEGIINKLKTHERIIKIDRIRKKMKVEH